MTDHEPIDPSKLVDRIPRFEIHIRPMFRHIDREHMIYWLDESQRFDLFKYEDVKKHAIDILEHLQTNMPTNRYGGPWPKEWILLFERWVDKECPRLELGTASKLAASLDADRIVTLTGSATAKTKGERLWLERDSDSETPRRYALYREPGSAASDPFDLPLKEFFSATPGVAELYVTDSTGERRVEIK